MIPISSTIEDELRKGNVKPIDLIEVAFPGGTERASLGDQDVPVGGVNYPRRHDWLSITGLEANADNVASAWRLTVGAIDPTRIDDLYDDNLQGSTITRSRVLINRLTGAVVADTAIVLDVRELHLEEIIENESQADATFLAETIMIDQLDPTRDARTQASHTRKYPSDNFYADVNQIQRGLDVQLATLVVERR